MNAFARMPRRVLPWALLLLPALAGAPSQAGAQERSRDERSELEERVRERFAEMIKSRLGLDDTQERMLADVVASFQDERRALGRRKGQLRRRIRSLDLDDRDPELDVTGARGILDEMEAVRAEEVRLTRAEQEALLQVLDPVQVLQFYELREDMAERIRRARRRGGDHDDHDKGDGGSRDGGRHGPGGEAPPPRTR